MSLRQSLSSIVCGRDRRLLAAHEDVLCYSLFLANVCHGQFKKADTRRIDLSDEEPEIFLCVLEYLYEGDYYPHLRYN